jgi:hypothetical protein
LGLGLGLGFRVMAKARVRNHILTSIAKFDVTIGTMNEVYSNRQLVRCL